jgi:hypothetical protein
MAPEVLERKPADQRSDVWQLDYLPSDPANTTIQLRDFDERTEDQPSDARAA